MSLLLPTKMDGTFTPVGLASTDILENQASEASQKLTDHH